MPSKLFPNISRPGEYVALVTFTVSTNEGPGYVFMGCDGFIKFSYFICVERDDSPESIIKAVYLLTENKDFVKYMSEGFTLVLDRWEELSDRLEVVVTAVNGKILYDKDFHKEISEDMVKSFNNYLENGPPR